MSDAESARERLRALARGALEAARRASDASAAVRETLAGSTEPLTRAGPIRVLAFGKAALPTLRGTLDALGGALEGGLAVLPEGQAGSLRALGPVRLLEAAHPLPDRHGQRAAAALLRAAASAPGDVLVLGSGGGSALVGGCPPGLALSELRDLLASLLASSADIRELNTVRRLLSLTLGGKLARALGRRRVLSLLVSDVPGDEPGLIASGPTVAGDDDWSAARAVLERVLPPERLRAGLAGLRAAEAAAASAERAEADCEPAPGRSACRVVLRPRDAAEAAGRFLEAEGLRVELDPEHRLGELAALVQTELAALAPRAAEAAGGSPQGLARVGFGELALAVPVAAPPGGRNQHAALLAALRLEELERAPGGGSRALVFASFATDGCDGSTGAAGGLVDAGTAQRARDAGEDPAAALAGFRAGTALEAAGDLLVTGATGSNLADLHLAIANGARAPAPDQG